MVCDCRIVFFAVFFTLLVLYVSCVVVCLLLLGRFFAYRVLLVRVVSFLLDRFLLHVLGCFVFDVVGSFLFALMLFMCCYCWIGFLLLLGCLFSFVFFVVLKYLHLLWCLCC